jgi:UDP-glucose 4-epimerase
MKSKTILVTGGAGFIGSHLTERLISEGYLVTVVDNFSSGLIDNLPPKATLFKLAVSDPGLEKIIKKQKPEIIFHLAAASSIQSPKEAVLTSNVAGSYNLFSAAASSGVKKVIFASSAAVYGPVKSLSVKETSPLKADTAYGLSKLTGELYGNQFSREFKVTNLRFANVYGPRQKHQGEGGVVSIFANWLLAGKSPIIFGDGEQTRDFIFVDDVVSALIKAMSGSAGTYNVSTNESVSINQLLSQLQSLMSTDFSPQFAPVRPADIKDSRLDNSLIKQIFNWQPKTNLLSGLSQTINYFKSRKV